MKFHHFCHRNLLHMRVWATLNSVVRIFELANFHQVKILSEITKNKWPFLHSKFAVVQYIYLWVQVSGCYWSDLAASPGATVYICTCIKNTRCNDGHSVTDITTIKDQHYSDMWPLVTANSTKRRIYAKNSCLEELR